VWRVTLPGVGSEWVRAESAEAAVALFDRWYGVRHSQHVHDAVRVAEGPPAGVAVLSAGEGDRPVRR